MALIGVTSRGISIKLIGFYILFFLDIFLTSFIEMSFATSLSSEANIYSVYALFAYNFILICLMICFRIQISTTFLLMGGFFVLMWSTFLLRFGLLGILLKNFKWTLGTFLIYSIFIVGERTLRLVLYSIL